MSGDEPKWKRRKEDRPAEIIDAAMDAFVVYGYAGTKLSEVAKRAGVAKGTLYLYFETKEDLFRATARQEMLSHRAQIEKITAQPEGSFEDILPRILQQISREMGDPRRQAFFRMVVAESRAFPDIGRIWHDEMIVHIGGLLNKLIEDAQKRGEVRAGDPNLISLSLFGGISSAHLFHDLFGPESPFAPSMDEYLPLHAQIVLNGILLR